LTIFNFFFFELGDRQYVVSGLAPEQERLRRNLFWAKQSLSSQLKLSWKIPTQGRVGVFPAELLPVQEAHVSAVRTSFLYIATRTLFFEGGKKTKN